MPPGPRSAASPMSGSPTPATASPPLRAGGARLPAPPAHSVVAVAVARDLIASFPEVDAGGLTKIHNQAVSGVSCAEVGQRLGVPAMLEAAEPEADLAISAE